MVRSVNQDRKALRAGDEVVIRGTGPGRWKAAGVLMERSLPEEDPETEI